MANNIHGTHAPPDDSLAVLKSLAEVSALFVGFTYVGGWSYVASYYSAFGLNALELELPLPTVCTTCVFVLYSARWPIYVVAAICAGWCLLDHYQRRYRRGVTAIAALLLLVIASVAGALHGRHRAMEDMLNNSNALPYVAFSTRLETTDQPPCVDHNTYGSSDCKLLLHSKGIYYFFTPIPNSNDALLGVGNLNVYTLADSDVTGVHISRGLERNVGKE